MNPSPALALAMVPVLNDNLLTPEHWRRLEGLCRVLDREPWMTFAEDRAAALLPDVEILLTGWGSPLVDREVLERAPKLRAIVHAAGTVKQHLAEVCWERGLQITSAAAANAVPVAELTLAAILFANKRVFEIRDRYRQVREFRWWPLEFPGLGNYRKTIGIVGASFVGRKVIEMLRPFAFDVCVYDPYLDVAAAAALGVRKVELDDLLVQSDVVSLHAPALPETQNMLDAARLRRIKDGATLINTARGALIDPDALERELQTGRFYAVLDTTEPEILPPSSPLYDLPNVFLTPHIAGSMGTETQRMADLAIDEIERFVRGQPFAYAIRHEDLPRIA